MNAMTAITAMKKVDGKRMEEGYLGLFFHRPLSQSGKTMWI